MKEKTLTPRLKSKMLLRSLVLLVVNVLLIIITITMLGRIRSKAEEVKALENKALSGESTTNALVLRADLANNGEKIDRLEDAFADEERLLQFVNEIDLLKREGVVTRFSFETNGVVVDKITKAYALKFIIDFQGDRNLVNAGISKVESLGFVIRPEIVALTKAEDGTIVYRYQGYLYVDESVYKN